MKGWTGYLTWNVSQTRVAGDLLHGVKGRPDHKHLQREATPKIPYPEGAGGGWR